MTKIIPTYVYKLIPCSSVNICKLVCYSDMNNAVLYTGRGTSQFCVSETLKALADLHVPATCIDNIAALSTLPLHGKTVLGKISTR
jgi:hypothetical protein